MASVQASPDPQLLQFYRRPLPEMCISFCSPEGKSIFREALESGNMENYFPLAAQFRTQEEPAFCGLSSLVMVLNTLEVDPCKVWKGPWRWYHENMLDCCVPIEIIAKSGITFDQFSCLAVCNTLKVKAFRADDKVTEDQFREEVKRVSQLTEEVVVVSYSRQGLGQTGSGHFSPIGGYHPGKDLVLILDVARFKYPPHWVTLHSLFTSMQHVDGDTGLARGYIVLSKSQSLPTVLFRLASSLSITGVQCAKLVTFIQDWNAWLSTSSVSKCSNRTLESCVSQLLKLLDVKELNLFITLVDVALTNSISDEHKFAIQEILLSLERLPIYETVKNCIPVKDTLLPEDFAKMGLNEHVVNAFKLCNLHYVVVLLLMWPYADTVGSFASEMDGIVKKQLKEHGGELLRNEIGLIRQQMVSVFGAYDRCTCKRSTQSCNS